MKPEKLYRLEVYIPSKTQGGSSIAINNFYRSIRDEIRKDAIAGICSHAGGCTSYEGQGVWVDPADGFVHREDVEVLTSWVKGSDVAGLREFIVGVVLPAIKIRLDQSMAMAVLAGEMLAE